MKLIEATRRALEALCKVLLLLSLIAVLSSLHTMVAVAQDTKAGGRCTDTSCWPDYTFICQRISSSCHCDGTWCK